MLRLYVRRPDGSREGILDEYGSWTIVEKWRDVSTFVLEADLRVNPVLTDFERGWGIELADGDESWFSGYPDKIERDDDGKTLTLKLEGVSDTNDLNRYFTEPPAGVDVLGVSGTLEGVARRYVTSASLPHYGQGSDAPTSELPRIDGGIDLGRGPVVTQESRYDNLFTLVQKLFNSVTSDLGFRVIGKAFDVYQATDRSNSVVFSRQLKNLGQVVKSETLPKVTGVIVAGQGQGAARTIQYVAGAGIAGAGDFFGFVDRRDSNDPAVLTQAGQDALNQGAVVRALTLTPLQRKGSIFHQDYFVGDMVTVQHEGDTIVDRIQQAKVTQDNGKRTVELAIGTAGFLDATRIPQFIVSQRKVADRVAALEKRA